jgi:hypothetical protein
MPRTRPFPTLVLLTLVGAPSLVACSSSDPVGPHSQPAQISTTGVLLEGDASEAQLSTFLHRKPRDWAWAGGQFDTPDDQAALAADAAQTFSWHADPADFAASDDTGDAVMTHLLSFGRANGGGLLQVFTTLPEYTPDTVAWQKLVDAGEPITLSLTTGSFVGADLPEAGGPFIGQSLTFTIE